MKDRLEQLKAVRDPRRGEGTGDILRGVLRKKVTPGWGSPRPHLMVGGGVAGRGDPKNQVCDGWGRHGVDVTEMPPHGVWGCHRNGGSSDPIPGCPQDTPNPWWAGTP